MGATAAMAGTMIQTISSFNSQKRQANATVAQGAFEKAQYDRNAGLADLQATDATRRGEVSADLRGQQTRQDIGQTRASLAGQGVVLDSGTAVNLQTDSAKMGALDIATIRNNAAREAWGYTTQAENMRYQGTLAANAAQSSAMGQRADSINTLITGAAKTYGLYRQKSDNTDTTGRKSVAPKASRTPAPTLVRRGVDTIPLNPGNS